MNVSDYILEFLAKHNTRHVFLITGGAIMFLIDRFTGRKDIKYICVQNEQAAAMAADAYSRLSEGIGVAMATSGPGATNLITGICCSWFDSIPAIFITGQVNTTESARGTKIRQVGFQETDIVSICKPITKYAKYLDKAEDIRYELEKALYTAQNGRPGPVLLDIPMNLQKSDIEASKLLGYDPPAKKINSRFPLTKCKIQKIITLIKNSKRPVIVCGGGVRNGKAVEILRRIAEKLGIPVVLTFMGIDCLPFNHYLHAGFFGTYGLRGANFTVANADLLLCFGTRLDVRQTGTNASSFARGAKKVVVDIDPEEIGRRIKADVSICSDVKQVFLDLLDRIHSLEKVSFVAWQKKVLEWKNKYPACLRSYYKSSQNINPYVFMKILSDEAKEGDVIIPDAGGNLMWAMQTWELKEGQRFFSAGGMSPMGYAHCAAIGASFAKDRNRVICTVGDGGFQINPQELQTIAYYKLPIKLFIINNRCYGIIKQFQRVYLKSNFQATDVNSGYSAPDFIRLAKAYGLKTVRLVSHKNLRSKIRKILAMKGSVICDVFINADSQIEPKLEVGHPIEDAMPYLPRKEFLSNMIVKP